MDTKACYRCSGSFPLQFFAKDKSKPDLLSIYCRNCSKEKRLEHRLTNPVDKAKAAEYQKRWRVNHPEYRKRYSEESKASKSEYDKKYREGYRDRRAELTESRLRNDPDYFKKSHKRSKEKNGVSVRAQSIANRMRREGASKALQKKQYWLDKLNKLFLYCGICNCRMNAIGSQGDKRRTASVDRINNLIGYTEDNIWLICYECNVAKRTSNPNQLFMMAEKVLEEMVSREQICIIPSC